MTCRPFPALAPLALSLAFTLASAQEGAPGEMPREATANPAAGEATAEPAAAGTEPRQAEPAGTVAVTQAGPQLLTEDLRSGFGDEARFGMTLTVHYTGWLYEAGALGYRGRKFDSSHDRSRPFQLTLGEGRVIKGWEVGIAGMQVGGLRRLVIPPEMAYGSRSVGNGLIPPDSTLVFEVELLGVESGSFVQNAK
jgi:FKBP-type peptidyl-prolyl cis-trans isomerase FkpA